MNEHTDLSKELSDKVNSLEVATSGIARQLRNIDRAKEEIERLTEERDSLKTEVAGLMRQVEDRYSLLIDND